MIADLPKVSLSYNPVSGEFTLKITNTSRVSYTLEYDWENTDDEGNPYGGTEAIINTDDANSSLVFQESQLAGTESSGDKFVHQPTKGVLTLSADTPDGKVMSYESAFKITESGEVKIISQKTSSKAKDELTVLGESSASATTTGTAEPTVATFSQPKVETRTTTVPQEIPDKAATSSAELPLLPIGIGVGVAVVIAGLIGVWWYKKQNAKLQKL
jgi:hypothetical protein